MQAIIKKITTNRYEIITFLVSVIVAMFLFYIDEGYYTFKYLTDPPNLVMLAIYIVGLWAGQLITAEFLLKKQAGWIKMMVGVPFGFILTVSFFMFLYWIRS